MVALSGCTQRPDRARFENTSATLEERDQPVGAEDLEILERAAALLGDASLWDRTDDRTCDPAARQLSLFCALQRASIEVLGEYQHRRVAMQEVRFAIEDITGGREFEHRLMDFNNLPETTFDDVERVLSIARQRVAHRLGGSRAPASPTGDASTGHAFKGYELYSWQDAEGAWRFALLEGTNRLKSPAEIIDVPLSEGELLERLSALPAGETVSWCTPAALATQPPLRPPPAAIVARLLAHARAHEVRLDPCAAPG